MVGFNNFSCPNCRGNLKYYDSVPRVIRTKGRVTEHVILRRLKCSRCNKLHREIPDYIYPHKQYEAEIIRGVLEGFITPDTFGFEDYPCENTIKNWQSHKTDIIEFEQLRFNFDAESSLELSSFR